MSTEETKTLFTVTKATLTESGAIEFEFDLSDEFVDMFKRDHNLKRWSQKKFDKWVSENIDAIVELAGIGDQLAQLKSQTPQSSENENNTNEE